jgi:integrase
MAAAYFRGGVGYVRVPRRAGAGVVRTTGTSDRSQIGAVESVLKLLRRRNTPQAWALLDAAAASPPRLPLLRLLAAYEADALDELADALEAEHGDQSRDLTRLIPAWLADVEARLPARVTSGKRWSSAERYAAHLARLIPRDDAAAAKRDWPWARFTAADATPEKLSAAFGAARGRWGKPMKPATRIRVHAAWRSFFDYCARVGAIASNPMDAVRAPAAPDPRTRYLDRADVVRLVEAHEDASHRALAAFLHATGVELGVALSLRRRDVDLARRWVRAHGRKRRNRNRTARLAAWALPYVEPHLGAMLPEARVWPLSQKQAERAHHRARGAAGIADYTIHDARHSYAVDALRRGASVQAVAQNLGNRPEEVLHTYGAHLAREADYEWEHNAIGGTRTDTEPQAAPATRAATRPARRTGGA